MTREVWNKGITKEQDKRIDVISKERTETINKRKLNSANREDKKTYCPVHKINYKSFIIHIRTQHKEDKEMVLRLIGNLCQCGCGEYTANYVIRGHFNDKMKKEISEANTGKPKTEEHKKKSGEANKIALKEYYKENPDILEKNV